MSFTDLLRVEFKLVYGELIRRRSAFIAMVIYPYLFAGFTLFFGYAMGSPKAFIARVGVDPIVYMVTASFLLLSILVSVDDILWKPLNDQWIGTLPYIIASPVNRVAYYLSIPIPRLITIVLMGFTSIIPIYMIFYGIAGVYMGVFVLLLSLIGGLSMVTLAMTIAGIVHTIGESWRVLNIVRPILMILIGAYYPRFLMPLTGYILSYMIPSSHIVETIQRMLSGMGGNFYLLLAIAFTLALLYTPVGKHSIVFWEKKKVREGVKVS